MPGRAQPRRPLPQLARELTEERFGFDTFRPGQEEAIAAVWGGRDTLAVLPTGLGKSFIYQLAALLIEGSTIVVSPLIALQQGQVSALAEIDTAAAANSFGTASERAEALASLRNGDLEFLLLSPEQLAHDDVLAEAAAAEPSLLVVDEAHCISRWGHDFRPDYLGLGGVIERLSHPPVLALTATAAPPVREEIVQRLGMRDPAIVVAGFDRPNISLSVERFVTDEDKRAAVIEAAATAEAPGIVYTATRRGAEQLAEAIGPRAAA